MIPPSRTCCAEGWRLVNTAKAIFKTHGIQKSINKITPLQWIATALRRARSVILGDLLMTLPALQGTVSPAAHGTARCVSHFGRAAGSLTTATDRHTEKTRIKKEMSSSAANLRAADLRAAVHLGSELGGWRSNSAKNLAKQRNCTSLLSHPEKKQWKWRAPGHKAASLRSCSLDPRRPPECLASHWS